MIYRGHVFVTVLRILKCYIISKIKRRLLTQSHYITNSFTLVPLSSDLWIFGRSAAFNHKHYGDVIMGEIAHQIVNITIVYSTVYSDADQRKHQSSVSLAFVWGTHRGPVNSPHKWPVTLKMFPFDDVIIRSGDAYTCQWNDSWLVQAINWHLLGVKPLAEPRLTNFYQFALLNTLHWYKDQNTLIIFQENTL